MTCKCDTCDLEDKTECSCPLWGYICCNYCGKKIKKLTQYYINFTEGRKIIWQHETKCCSKECFEKWRVEIDKFEEEFQHEISVQTSWYLNQTIKKVTGLNMNIKLMVFLMRNVLHEFGDEE